MMNRSSRSGWVSRMAGLVVAVGACAGAALAGPTGEQVVSGSARFARDGNSTIIEAANNTIINYSSFNIGAGESVRFVQPSAAARVLNRDLSGNRSLINGSLTANGIVYIANPAGVFFGGQSVVNVAGLYAAAGSITNRDFLNNIDLFSDLEGSVVNEGHIQGHLVHLIGQRVVNRGTIFSDNGLVTLLAGDEVYIGERGEHIMVKVDAAAGAGDAPAVDNRGTIDAGPGGKVTLAAGDMYSLAVRDSGSVRGGEVTVDGGDGGRIDIEGSIDASSDTGAGGTVGITGDQVALYGAYVDVSGQTTGGELTIDAASVIMEGGFVDATGGTAGGHLAVYTDDVRFNTIVDVAGGETGGSILIDPLSAVIAAAGDVTPAAIVAGLSGGDFTVEAENIISVDELVDSSAQGNSNTLRLQDENNPDDGLTINLNALITLGASQTLEGDGTTINVAAAGSIQNAIDVAHASDGATITTADAAYGENLLIDKPDLTLQSTGGGATINLQGGGHPGSQADIVLRANADNFTLGGAGVGFTINENAATDRVIELENGPTGVTLEDNTINMTANGAGTIGISVGAAGADNLTITDNDFTVGDGDGAIWGPDVSNVDVIDNTFAVNGGAQTSGYAVQFSGITGASTIRGNTIDQYNRGILLYSSDANDADGVTVEQNTITNSAQQAIWLTTVAGSGTVENITIQNNVLTGNDEGIQIDADGGATVDTSTLTISDNNLSGNTAFGLDNDNAGTVNASGNWWGSDVPATALAEADGAVDITPFLNTSTDTDGGTAGFQGDFSDITVTGSGSQTGATDRVQEGLNLLPAAGGTLDVAGITAQNNALDFNKGGGATINMNVVSTAGFSIGAAGGIADSAGDDDTLNLDIQASGVVDLNAAVDLEDGTFSSAGTDFDNTGGAITASTIGIDHSGGVTVGANLTGDTSTSVRSGSDGTGDVGFGAGVTVRGDSITLRAGDGTGGGGTAAVVDALTNAPSFRNGAGAAEPDDMTFRQDGDIVTATHLPAAAQFGGTLPDPYTITSDDGGIDDLNHAALTGADLTLTGSAGADTFNFTGTVGHSVTYNAGNGTNDLNVDLSGGGNTLPTGGIAFNGGTGTDSIDITGGTHTDVTYNFTGTGANGNDGSVVMTGTDAGTITFTGLDPLANTGTAANVIFNLPDVVGTPNTDATVADTGGADGNSILTGTTFENTTFANPSTSLTVNMGDQGDTVIVNALDAAFDATVSIVGGTGVDTADINAITGTKAYSFDGQAGATNTLDLADLTSQAVNVTGLGGTVGFAGNFAAVPHTFDDVTTVVGSTAGTTDSVTSYDTAANNSTWTIDGGSETFAGDGRTLTLTDFETFTGSAEVDTFNVQLDTLDGAVDYALDGAGGADVFALALANGAAVSGNSIDIIGGAPSSDAAGDAVTITDAGGTRTVDITYQSTGDGDVDVAIDAGTVIDLNQVEGVNWVGDGANDDNVNVSAANATDDDVWVDLTGANSADVAIGGTPFATPGVGDANADPGPDLSLSGVASSATAGVGLTVLGGETGGDDDELYHENFGGTATVTPTGAESAVITEVGNVILKVGEFEDAQTNGSWTLAFDTVSAGIGNTGDDDTISLILDGGGTNLLATFTDDVLGSFTFFPIPLASLTDLDVTGSNDSDKLIVDGTNGLPIPTGDIDFNAGGETSGPGDSLQLDNFSPDRIVHSFTNANDGVVTIDTDGTLANADDRDVNYFDLEPIADNMSPANRVFTFSNVVQTITLSDDAAPADNVSVIDSTVGEQVTFVGPTTSLTINGGTNNDTINVEAVDITGAMAGGVAINGNAGDDAITLGATNQDLDLLDTFTYTVDAGANNDTLTVDDSADNTNRTMAISDTQITRTAGPTVAYSNAETLNVNGGTGNDTVNVTGISATTTTAATFDAGSGSDTYNVTLSGTYGTAAAIADSAGAADTLNVIGTAGNETLDVNGTTATLGIGGITTTYTAASIETLVVDSLAGDTDNIQLTGNTAINSVTLNAADGQISNTDAGTTNVTGTTLNAIADDGIVLDTAVTTLNLSNNDTGAIDIDNTSATAATVSAATTADGTITIDQAGGGNLIANMVASGNDQNVTLTTSGAGDVLVNSVTAGAGQITVTSAGAIGESGSDAGIDLAADTLDLNAVTGIGPAAAIETAATTIDADSTGAGNVNLANTGGADVTVNSLTADTGDVTFDQFGGVNLAVTNTATTTSGSIHIDVTNGNLQVTTATAAGAAQTVTLGTTTSGNVTLDDVTAAGAGSGVVLDSAGTVNDLTGGNELDADITAANATINGTAIGAAGNPLDTVVDSLTTNTSGAGGDQFITEANALTALNVNAGAGDVTLVATLGAVTDGDGAADLSAATATVTLSDAGGADFGAAGNRMDTDVTNLAVDTSAGNGDQFIDEASGLSNLDLDAGTGAIDLLASGAVDDAAADGVDVLAADLTLSASGGIGLTSALDTDVDNLDVTNSTGGATNITNNGALVLTDLNASGTAVNAAAGGTIVASSPLTIASDSNVGGTFKFDAADSGGAGDDLTLNTGVTVTQTGTNSTLTFEAGDHVTFQGTATVAGNAGNNNTVVVTADAEGDGSGLISQTGTAISVTTDTLDLNADGGIRGNTVNDPFITAATVLTADNSGAAPINIENRNAAAVTVNTLTTAGGQIDFVQDALNTNTGTLTVNGNATTSGSDIEFTVNNFTGAGDMLFLSATANVDTTPGAGGIIVLGAGVDLNGAATLNPGGGNIILNANGSGLDYVHDSDFTFAGPVRVQVERDIIVSALLATSAGDIELFADSATSFPAADVLATAEDGVGGVRVTSTGNLDSAAALDLRGSDVSATATNDDGIRIAGDIESVGQTDLLTRQGENVLLGAGVTTTGAGGHVNVGLDPAGHGGNTTPTVIIGDTTLTASNAAGSNVTFWGEINDDASGASSSDLVINSSGVTDLRYDIGTTSPIESITTDDDGATADSTTMGAGEAGGDGLMEIVTNGGTQTFNDPVVLNADTTAIDAGSGVFYNNTVDSDGTARNLTVITTGGGTTRFGNAAADRVGAISALASLTTDSAGNGDGVTILNADQIDIDGGTATFHDNVQLGNTVLIDTTDGGSTATGGDVTFNGTLNATAVAAQGLTVEPGTSGDVLFAGVVGGNTRLGPVAIGVARDVQSVTANANFTARSLNIQQATGTGDTFFDAGVNTAGTAGTDGGDITINTNDNSVTLNGSSGSTTLAGGTPPAGSVGQNGGNLTIDGATISVGAVSTNGSSAQAPGTHNGGNAGDITYERLAGGNPDITLRGDQTAIGGSGVNGGAQGDAGAIDMDGPVTLGATLTIDTGESANPGHPGTADIDIAGTISGPFGLTLNAGDGNIITHDTINPLATKVAFNLTGALQVDDANDWDVLGTTTAASITQTAGSGTTTFDGDVTANTSSGIALNAAAFVFDDTLTPGDPLLVTTNNGQITVDGPTTINHHTTFTTGAAGTGTIQFSSAFASEVGSPWDLVLTAGTGQVIFNSTIGGAANTQVNSLTVTSALNVDFQDDVRSHTFVDVTASNQLTIGGPMTGDVAGNADGSGYLTFTVNVIDIDDVVSADGNPLTIQPFSQDRNMGVGIPTGALDVSAAEVGLFDDGFSGIFLGRAGFNNAAHAPNDSTGTMKVGNVTFGDPVEFAMPGTGGSIDIEGAVTTADPDGGGPDVDNASFLFNSPEINLGADVTTNGAATTAAINFDNQQAAGGAGISAVTVTAVGVDVDTSGGDPVGSDIFFDGTIDADTAGVQDLTLDAGSGGTITMTGAVGSNKTMGPITVTDADTVTAMSTFRATSYTQLDGTTLTDFQDAVTLTTGNFTGDGDAASHQFLFQDTMTVTLGDIDIDSFRARFQGVVNVLAGTMTVSAADTSTADQTRGLAQDAGANFNVAGAFASDDVGINNLSADISAGLGAQPISFTGPVVLNQDVTHTGSASTYLNSVDADLPGDQGLAIVGNAVFGNNAAPDRVGDGTTVGTGALGFLTITGDTTVRTDVITVSSAGGGTGLVQFGDPTAPLDDAVTLDNQVGGGSITVTGDTIDFRSTIDESGPGSINQNLTAASTNAGDTFFRGTVGGTERVASVTTNADGTTHIMADMTTNGGTMVFNDPVLIYTDAIGGTRTLTDFGDTGIAFNNLLDQASTLTDGVTAAPAGSSNLALNVDADNNGAGQLTFGDGAGDFVGSVRALNDLIVGANGFTRFNAGDAGDETVETVGNQNYGNSVILGADTTLLGNNVTFGDRVNSDAVGTPRILTVNTTGGGVTSFNGSVGVGDDDAYGGAGANADKPLRAIVTNADGSTTIGGGVMLVNGTVADQTHFGDAVSLTSNLNFAEISGAAGVDATFGSTVDAAAAGTQGLVVSTIFNGDVDVVFVGAVGATRPLGFLTSDLAADQTALGAVAGAYGRTEFQGATLDTSDAGGGSATMTFNDRAELNLGAGVGGTPGEGSIVITSTVTGGGTGDILFNFNDTLVVGTFDALGSTAPAPAVPQNVAINAANDLTFADTVGCFHPVNDVNFTAGGTMTLNGLCNTGSTVLNATTHMWCNNLLNPNDVTGSVSLTVTGNIVLCADVVVNYNHNGNNADPMGVGDGPANDGVNPLTIDLTGATVSSDGAGPWDLDLLTASSNFPGPGGVPGTGTAGVGGPIGLGGFTNGGGNYVNALTLQTNSDSGTGPGNLTLTADITLENDGGANPGDFQFIGGGNNVLTTSVTVDTNADDAGASGVFDLGATRGAGAAFDQFNTATYGETSSTVAGSVLTVNTDTAGAAGNVLFGAFGNTAGSYLNQIAVNNNGGGGDGATTLHGDVLLDNDGATLASFTVTGDGNVIVSPDAAIVGTAGTVLVDTEQGDDASGGLVNFNASPISSDAADQDLSLMTNTGFATGTGGAVTFGLVDNVGGGFFLQDLRVNTEGDTAGGGGDGVIQTGATIQVDDNASTNPGSVTFLGNWELLADTTIDTENGAALGDNTGGAVNLTDAQVYSDGGTGPFDLTVNTATAGATGGAVQLGLFTDFADTAAGAAGDEAFVNNLNVVTTSAGGAGATTLHGDVLLDNDGATLASFTVTGDGNVIVSPDAAIVGTAGTVLVDTEQGDDASGGLVNFNASPISSDAADQDLSLMTNTGFATGTGGAVTFGLVDNVGGGFFLQDLRVNTEGDTAGGGGDGVIQTGATIQVDDNASTNPGSVTFLGNWELLADTTIDTENGAALGDNTGGAVNLTDAQVYSDGGTGPFDLTVNTATAGATGGAVQLGLFTDFADTAAGAAGDEAFVSVVTLTTTAGTTSGATTFHGDLLLDDDGGVPSALTVIGNGDIVVSPNVGLVGTANMVTIDTEQANSANGGPVDFNLSNVYADAAGLDLTVNTATTFGGGNGGAVTMDLVDDNAGGNSFINDLLIVTTGPLAGPADDGVILLTGGTANNTPGFGVATANDQTYTGPVQVDGDPTANDATTDLTQFDGNNVTFGSTLDAAGAPNTDPQSILINGAGLTYFMGAVGGNNALLEKLETDAAGTSRIDANVTTTGAAAGDGQRFGDPTGIGANGIVFTHAGPNGSVVRFFSTLDSVDVDVNPATLEDFDVTYTLTGGSDLFFDGIVGGNVRLGDVLVTSTDDLTAGAAFTAATFTQESALGSTLTGGTGNTTFQGMLDVSGVAAVLVNPVPPAPAGPAGEGGYIRLFTDGDITLFGGANTSAAAGSAANAGDVLLHPDLRVGVAVIPVGTARPLIAVPGQGNQPEDRIFLDGVFTLAGDGGAAGGTFFVSPDGRAAVPSIATISGRQVVGSDVTVNAGAFTTGQNEKATFFGDFNVTTTDGDITVGDVTAFQSIEFDVPVANSINLLLRPAGQVLDFNGGVSTDLALDIIAGNLIDFSEAPTLAGIGGSPDPIFASPGGDHDPGGFGGVLSPYYNRDTGAIQSTYLVLTGALADPPANVTLDFSSTGPSTANVAEAIAAATPRLEQSGDVQKDTAPGQSQRDLLARLGYDLESLSASQLIEFLSGRALYNDLSKRGSPYMVGGPGHDVTRDRLTWDPVTAVIATYTELFLYAEVDPATGDTIIKSRHVRLRKAIGRAFADYMERAGAFDAATFRAFLASAPAYEQANRTVEGLENLFRRIEVAGLTPAETTVAKTVLLPQITPEGMTPQQLQQVIETEPVPAGEVAAR